MHQGNLALSPRKHWENPAAKANASYGRLLYNYFRDYDPNTGRYVQSDPIGLEGGINTYGYANQNPVMFVDFFGLMSACLDCVLGCNETFKADEVYRWEQFMNAQCASKGKMAKAIDCHILVQSIDIGLRHYNRGKLQKCLKACSDNECKKRTRGCDEF